MENETQKIESHQLTIKSVDPTTYDDNFGIGYELFNNLKEHGTRIAQRDTFSNKFVSFDCLLQKSIKIASNLRASNLQEDPIIAIFSTNHADTCVPILASYFLGYKVNGYDCLLGAADVASLLKTIPPSVMFIDQQFVDKMESAMMLSGVQFELIVFGKSDKHKVFNKTIQSTEIDHFEPVKVQQPGKKTAVIMLSSGTTGLPKGICLSHTSLLKQASYLGSMLGLSEESVFLHFSAYNWITAHIILLSSILYGSSLVITSVATAWDAISKHKVSHIYAPPFGASLLLSQKKPESLNTRSVKCFITAGSRLNNVLYSELRNSFPEAVLSQSYGQTETTGWITIFQWHKKEDAILAEKNPDSVGRLFPGYICKIVDNTTGEILGPNQVGEIRLKSKCFYMNGYYNRDTTDIFDSAGWLKTGDLAYYDKDLCFYIVGRCKELLKYRGFHIRPQKLENILESHPAVDRAVVIGAAHPIDGERPKGIVSLKKGATNVTPEDLRLFVDDQVEDRLKLRGGLLIVEDIPMTSTGKPKRVELMKMIENTQK